MEGFAEAAIGASGNSPFHVTPRDECRDGNDSHVLRKRIGFDARAEFEAVEPGHDQVQNQQLRFERRHSETRVIAVGRRRHLIALLTQGQTEHVNDSWIVIDYQDAWGDLENEIFRHGKPVGIEKGQEILLRNSVVSSRCAVGLQLARFNPVIDRKVGRLAVTGDISSRQNLRGMCHMASRAVGGDTAWSSIIVILKLQNLKKF